MLHENEHVACMDTPNILVPLDDTEEMDNLGLYKRWPLVMLEAFDENAGEQLGAVFVDAERHKTPYHYEWKNHPPTWMDPHLLMEMARKDPRVQKVCRVAFKKNDLEAWKRLMPLLRETFDEEYLPYVIERFEKMALKLLAQWLLRSHGYRKTDPCAVAAKQQAKKKARRRPQPPVE